jgi:hypothetical protein
MCKNAKKGRKIFFNKRNSNVVRELGMEEDFNHPVVLKSRSSCSQRKNKDLKFSISSPFKQGSKL